RDGEGARAGEDSFSEFSTGAALRGDDCRRLRPLLRAGNGNGARGDDRGSEIRDDTAAGAGGRDQNERGAPRTGAAWHRGGGEGRGSGGCRGRPAERYSRARKGARGDF